MGRPIKKKFFGNLNGPYNNAVTRGLSGTGGESLASVTITNSGTHYSAGAVAVVGTPDLFIDGNTTATITIAINSGALGNIATTTVVNTGGGYINTPSISIVKPATVTSTVNSGLTATNTFTVSTTAGISIGMLIAGASTGNAGYVTAINGNIISSTVNNNAPWTNASNLTFSDNGSGAVLTAVLTSRSNTSINITAWAPTVKVTKAVNSSGSAIASDILEQKGSHSYQIKNNQGYGRVKLVAKTPAIGEANIIATDRNGNTYYVTKLTSRKAYVTRLTQNGANAWLFVSGTPAKWILSQGTQAAVGYVNLAAD
jgi:hypothetical protein